MDKIYLLIGNDTPLAVCLRKSEGEETPVPYDLSTAERMRLALVGHGMHVFAEDIEISGEDNNIISGVIPGRSLLKGDYDLEVTFNLDGRDKRFAVKDMFEAVDFLAEDADGEAEGEGAGIFVTVTVQPELIEISGPTGPQGKSAYQVWLDDGHTGTEDDFFEWLAAQTPNPDWEQNDPSKADYIKNRTHWEEESSTTINDASLAWSGSTPEDLDFWFHGTNVHIPRTSTGWGLTWQGGELFIDDMGSGYEIGVFNGEGWSYNPFDPSYDQQPYPLNVDVVITSGTTVHKLDNKFLDMDSEPTTGSGKPVTSGGVKAAIADFVTRAVNDLLNYYTKTETYTKAEVNQLVAGINNWEIVPVAQLPEASADTMHKIYLVPSSNPKTRNVKDEFITVEVSGAYSWEQIGTTAIDLTNYVTKQELTEALADYVTSTAFTQALALKQDVIVDLQQIRAGAADTVKYTSQSLTDAQKEQARANIGAASDSEVSQLRSDVDDKTSIKAGMTDKTILTNSTTNVAYVWFQVTPKLSHVDKIRFLAKSGTVTFYKVKVAGSTATMSEIQSVVNTSGENQTVKEINVNVDLGADEYIGVNGSFYYRSSGQVGFQSAYCNAAGTTIWWTGNGFACGFETVRYTNSVAKEYLDSKGGIFTIKKSGGDFADIYSALIGTYGLDSASNPITLIVYPGSYETPTLAYSDFFATWLQKRYLSIIGTDKVNCILRNDKGYYNASSSGENLGDNSVIKINGNVYIANLTLISTDDENESESSLLYHNSYCLHTDIDANENSILEIHNCRLINDHAPCIGFGIPKNCTLKLTDCELESTFFDPNVVNGGAVIYGHDRHGSTVQIEEHLVVKNCIIRSSNGHAVKFTNNNSSLADCVFVGNACALPSGKGISLDSTTTVIAPSFGNNVADMNAS